MKKKILTLLALFIIVLSAVNAQTTKPKASPKKATTTKIQQKEAVQQKAAVKANNATSTEQVQNDYQNAVGLKFIYGISVTGKHFIDQKGSALEAIIRYRNYGNGLGSEFNFSGLYEKHWNIEGAPGLRWYAGGGVYLGHASFNYIDESAFAYGITGVLGLEYKIKDIPLAISADWQPVFLLNNNSGFTGENGGIGVKYAF